MELRECGGYSQRVQVFHHCQKILIRTDREDVDPRVNRRQRGKADNYGRPTYSMIGISATGYLPQAVGDVSVYTSSTPGAVASDFIRALTPRRPPVSILCI